MSDYIPKLPVPLKPPIPELTTLSDWKDATKLGFFTLRNNQHTLAIDHAIEAYHRVTRPKDRLIELYRINQEVDKWLESKLSKDESSRREAYLTLGKHAKALCKYPVLDKVNRIVFRGDGRYPPDIFAKGFQPTLVGPILEIGEDGHTWIQGKNGKKDSQLISTSLCVYNLARHYAVDRYLFLVKAYDALDLRDNGDYEIGILKVPTTDIIAAVGPLPAPFKAETDVLLLGEVTGVPLNMNYYENPNCTVGEESRLYKLLFKLIAGQDIGEAARCDVFNMVNNNSNNVNKYGA